MYLEINSNNQVMGYSEDKSHNSVETDKNIPEFTDTQILKFVNGDFVVEDSQDLIDAKAEYDAQEYARSRRPKYPDIGDQLDDLYHKGAFSDEMAVKIKAVKDAHPKPE